MTANDLFAAERVIQDLTRDKQRLKAELEAEKLVNVKLPDPPRKFHPEAVWFIGFALLLGSASVLSLAVRARGEIILQQNGEINRQRNEADHLRWKNRELAKIIHDDQNIIRALNEELLNARKK